MRLLLVVAILGFALAERVSYEGHKVLRFRPTAQQLTQLRQFKNHDGFDFWVEPRVPGAYLDIMVSPGEQPRFFGFLDQNKIDFTILFDNVQRAIDAEDLNQRVKNLTRIPRAISFDQYYRHADINAYLQQLTQDHANLVTLETIGQSGEGLDMVVIKISSGGTNNPAVLIDAGIHAREWIAPAMALYVIQQLVENNSANSELTDGLDWYILPVLNPDGYEYAHTTDRMWRKTRSDTGMASCPGVDGNRNYDFHWMEVGASDYPCYEDYAGAEPSSEIETKNLIAFAEKIKGQAKLYLTFHSYGGYLLYPWGYTSSLPEDWETLEALAIQANDAHIAAGGEDYLIGSSTNVLYAAAGGSDDYMKGVKGIGLSYTIELTDTWYGFELPPELIEPTVTRFFEAVKVYGNYVRRNF